MAGLKRALLCKGTLPVSYFLTLPVHRRLPGRFLPAPADNPTVPFPFPLGQERFLLKQKPFILEEE